MNLNQRPSIQSSYLKSVVVSDVAKSLDTHPCVSPRSHKDYLEAKFMVDERKKHKDISK